MTDIDIHIRLFGAFRKNGQSLTLCLPAGSTIASVKQQISLQFTETEAALVFDSVLADEESILPDGFVLENNINLSILPPVCGG
ncbi:MAG: hypothetical protein EP349_02015 [Alphaproteobacteria bacterium]|nr:MAG: hypothetical protein EP349_02015 [Alphaproteobacteria bacterium]